MTAQNKVIIVGGMSPHDLEALMDVDLEVHHDEAHQPSATIAKVGDALPGLGIVAAVLGVVITMQAIDGPPSEIGHKVGAALVGTFLGILLSYGFMQPLSSSLEQRVQEDGRYEQCIKAGVMAFYKGAAPALNALIRGETEIAFPGVNSAAPFLRANKVRGLAVPPPDGVTELNLSTNRLGHTVRVFGLAQGKGQFGSRHSHMGGAGVTLEVDVSPSLGTDKRLMVIQARDDQGRTVQSIGHGSSASSFSFGFKPKADVQSLDFTLAVQEVVKAEFLVKPVLFKPSASAAK